MLNFGNFSSWNLYEEVENRSSILFHSAVSERVVVWVLSRQAGRPTMSEDCDVET